MDEKEQAAAAILRAKAELEQALYELEKIPGFDPGTVAYSAHVLNNYLTVTATTVELLLWSLADHPDTQIRIWLEGLGHVVELMRHTTMELMSSSAPREAAALRFLKWDLTLLVRRACNYYERHAHRKHISIVYELANDLPPVWTDPVAVAAVLDNLLSNAVKYSFPEKRIWVRLRLEGTMVECTVGDEGPGLNPEEQAKLFQRGVRLSPVPTGGESSNGYGLAVAKDLIDRLGGDLWCESAPGAGARFSFRLPIYQEQR